MACDLLEGDYTNKQTNKLVINTHLWQTFGLFGSFAANFAEVPGETHSTEGVISEEDSRAWTTAAEMKERPGERYGVAILGELVGFVLCACVCGLVAS